MLVSTSIPNLLSGVSQQPASMRFPSQAEVQVNAYPSVIDGLIKRPPTEHITKLVNGFAGTCHCHIINRDSTERYAVVFRVNQEPLVYDIVNRNVESVFSPNEIGYLTTSDPDRDLRVVTVADFTFVTNRNVIPAMMADKTPNRGQEVLITIVSGQYGCDYTISFPDGQTTRTYTVTTPNGGEPSDADDIQTDLIAAQLANRMLNAATGWVPLNEGGGVQGHTDWQVSVQGSTIWIRRGTTQPYGSFIVPEVTDSRNNTLTSLATAEVQNLVDLPLVAPHGYVAKVTGDPDATEDEYYVKFVANRGEGFGAGLWEETVAPDIKYKVNPATMPHILVRKSDGSFEFKQAVWDDRGVGNEEANPEPSFIGRPIKDIFFFKNRLGLLADDKVVMSEAGQYFNFWRTTVLQVLDGDPIDLGVAHTKVALLSAAVPFSENLVLFSDQTQFLLSSGGELLTPRTASITQTTEFRSIPGVRPVTNGKAIYFAEGRGDYSGIREYFQMSTDSKIFDAENLTQQVSAYIRGEVKEIEASTHDNIVFIRASGASDTLYGYKYLMNGTNRIQSAWFEFSFPGSNIKGIGWIDTHLYIFNQRSDGLHLERLTVEPGRRDPGLDIVVHLDRRMSFGAPDGPVSLTQQSVAYNPTTGTTSITLPYAVRVGATMQVVSADGYKQQVPPPKHPLGKIARLTSVSQNRLTVTVDEDWSTTPFYIGEKYEMVYQTSTPYIRQGESNVIVPQGCFQLTYGEIVYTNSSFFVVEVTPKYRDTYYYPFTGNIVGATAQVDVAPVVSGSFRFPVFAKNDEVTITIRNDSPLPCGLTSIDYEATYNTRSRRI